MRPTLLTTPDEAKLFVRVVTPGNQKITYELRRPIHATRQSFADLQSLDLRRWDGLTEQWMISLTDFAFSQECGKIRRIAERLGWTLNSQGLALFDEARNLALADRRHSIDLSGLSLSSLPEEIGHMPCLRSVDLSNNHLFRPPQPLASNLLVQFIVEGNPYLEPSEIQINTALANEA